MAWFDPLNNSGGVSFDFFDFTYLSIPPIKDIRESEDSVDAIVNIHNANVKLIERALLDVTDTNSVNSSPSATRWEVVQDSEGNLLQKQASELLDS